MVHSARRIALLLASFDVALPSKREVESTERLRFPPWPPRVEFCSVGSPRAGLVFKWAITVVSRDPPSVGSPRAGLVFKRVITRPIVRDDPWHHIDQLCYNLCIHALASARAFAAAICCARAAAGPSARKTMDLAKSLFRQRLLLLASHRTLTREHKNPSRIARETWIEFFSIFAWLVGLGPHVGPEHHKRFRVFRSTICWSD